MRRLHLIVGIAVLIIFLATGRFMAVDFPDKDVIPQELRLLLRSRHIYILFCALVHIVLGIYLVVHPVAWRKIFQYVGSLLLFLSAMLLIVAFIRENYYLRQFSFLSAFGVFASLGGVAFHLIGGITGRKQVA